MKGLYYPVAQHLQKFCQPGQFVIWRDAFRWKRHCPDGSREFLQDWEVPDEVLSNHYDGMELEQLADYFGYQIDWDTNMRHCAIVRKL